VANALQPGTKIGGGGWIEKIFEILSSASYGRFTKGQSLALSTILFNFSCLVLQERVETGLRTRHFRLIVDVLRLERTDAEVAYRGLVGLGNALYAAKEQTVSLEAAIIITLKTAVEELPAHFKDSRIDGIVSEILALF